MLMASQQVFTTALNDMQQELKEQPTTVAASDDERQAQGEEDVNAAENKAGTEQEARTPDSGPYGERTQKRMRRHGADESADGAPGSPGTRNT